MLNYWPTTEAGVIADVRAATPTTTTSRTGDRARAAHGRRLGPRQEAVGARTGGGGQRPDRQDPDGLPVEDRAFACGVDVRRGPGPRRQRRDRWGRHAHHSDGGPEEGEHSGSVTGG